MKKFLSTIAIFVLLALVTTGCSMGINQMPTDSGQNTVGQNLPQNNGDTNLFIGEAKAREIALEKAGISEDGVIFDNVELEVDNGIWKYEVEFRKDTAKYDIDIKADTGEVLKWEVDKD